MGCVDCDHSHTSCSERRRQNSGRRLSAPEQTRQSTAMLSPSTGALRARVHFLSMHVCVACCGDPCVWPCVHVHSHASTCTAIFPCAVKIHMYGHTSMCVCLHLPVALSHCRKQRRIEVYDGLVHEKGLADWLSNVQPHNLKQQY